MTTRCEQCGKASDGRRFCESKCKWTWHNHNRTLPKNTAGQCRVCGKWFARYNSPSRAERTDGGFCGRTCAGKWRTASNHPNWSGGKKIDKDGYVLVWVGPDHPNAVRGYVREHRLKMEKKIGRFLLRSEVVHHKNGNKADNRLRNLVLYTNNAEHKKEDINERSRDGRGRLLPIR